MYILIVEDKENLRQMLTAAVEKMGFAVDTAEDGRQAQVKIKQRRYALILTDLRLPKGSGLEILSYSRELDDMGEPTTKIADKERFHGADAVRYIVGHLQLDKPPVVMKGSPVAHPGLQNL